MEFEFDETKSNSNKQKHGIDFYEAQMLWCDPNYLLFPLPYVEEKRYGVIGKINGKCWTAIITYRNFKVRIISVRRSRKNERSIYESH